MFTKNNRDIIREIFLISELASTGKVQNLDSNYMQRASRFPYVVKGRHRLSG